MRFNIRHITEKIISIAPTIIEIGITSIHARSGEISKLIDTKVQEFLKKSKSVNKQRLRKEHRENIYKRIAQEQDASIELTDYYNERFSEQKEQRLKHIMIKRLHDLEQVKNMKRELDLEK